MSLVVSLAPAFEHRFGLYRLDRVDFPSDTSDESAMRLMVTPEPDASLLAASADAQLPAIIKSVSYSTWRVRSGDTLGGVLSRFGLRNMSTVLSANGISNARHLKVGQNLTIPSMDGIVYSVARGDSLGAHCIALRGPDKRDPRRERSFRLDASCGRAAFYPRREPFGVGTSQGDGRAFHLPDQGKAYLSLRVPRRSLHGGQDLPYRHRSCRADRDSGQGRARR